jgi:zinc transport system ATP-binding protein
LELTHATNLRKESFRELSGGQKQRVLLARALCAAERLLLLDEPVTGLDPESSQNMYNIIRDLHENKNMTIVMVTHDIDAARNNSTRILNFNEIMQ